MKDLLTKYLKALEEREKPYLETVERELLRLVKVWGFNIKDLMLVIDNADHHHCWVKYRTHDGHILSEIDGLVVMVSPCYGSLEGLYR